MDVKVKANYEMGMRTFVGKSGINYLVFKAPDGSYHTYTEIVARDAARDCGAVGDDMNTRNLWGQLWNDEKDKEAAA
jgi:hypothetical protein